jgi:hypothetical protein
MKAQIVKRSGGSSRISHPVAGLIASMDESDPHTVDIQYSAAFKAVRHNIEMHANI